MLYNLTGKRVRSVGNLDFVFVGGEAREFWKSFN